MSKALQQAKQWFDAQLDEGEQMTLAAWKKHLDQHELKEDYGVPSLNFDESATNDEIESLQRDHAIELRTITLNDTQRAKLRARYETLISNESDRQRVERLRRLDSVAPPILAGEDGEWWVYDGMHRMAIAAYDGMDQFPAWFIVHQRQLKQDETPNDLLKLRIELFQRESDRLAEQVYTGDISIGQWQESMKRLIKESHTGAAIIAKGGVEKMGPRDWGRLGTPIREQYKWLGRFAEYISENRDTISLKYLLNRSRMYGEALDRTATQVEAGFWFEDMLPWLPKDGSTKCLNRCKCRWVLDIVEEKPRYRVVECVWRMGEAEHCTDCIARDGHTVILRVPIDVDVPATIGDTFKDFQYKGGPGSGHHGHSGRPGKVGGSAPGGGGKGAHRPGLPGYSFTDDNALNYIKRGNSTYALGDTEERANVKSQIVDAVHARIPAEMGVTKEQVNGVLANWAETSNDSNVAALSLQEAASEEFGVGMSAWQQGKWNNVKENDFTRYYTHSNTLTRDKERAILRAMYDNTQADLRAQGYKPGDQINLFRGIVIEESATTASGNIYTRSATLPRGTMNYNGNAIESWSASSHIALGFTNIPMHGQNVLAQRVPIENIISTARAGLGCLPEMEFVVLGTVPGTQVEVLDT